MILFCCGCPASLHCALFFFFNWSMPACVLSHVQLIAISRTVARQAPPPMEFPRQEYWSGLPLSIPGDLPRGQNCVSCISCTGRWILYCWHQLGSTTDLQYCTSFSSVQSLSHVWLCETIDCSVPGFPVHHQFPELAETHVHQVSDTIQSSHPL